MLMGCMISQKTISETIMVLSFIEHVLDYDTYSVKGYYMTQSAILNLLQAFKPSLQRSNYVRSSEELCQFDL